VCLVAVACWRMRSIPVASRNHHAHGETACASGLADRWRVSLRLTGRADASRCQRPGRSSARTGETRTGRRRTRTVCDHVGRSVRCRCDERCTVVAAAISDGRHTANWCDR
jgi:hypothetical protein